MRMRLGTAGKWNASFDVMPNSRPGHSGIAGCAPTAIRIVLAVTVRPLPSDTWFGPVTSARALRISTPAFSSVCV